MIRLVNGSVEIVVDSESKAEALRKKGFVDVTILKQKTKGDKRPVTPEEIQPVAGPDPEK